MDDVEEEDSSLAAEFDEYYYYYDYEHLEAISIAHQHYVTLKAMPGLPTRFSHLM
jgi:hypothetical protein